MRRRKSMVSASSCSRALCRIVGKRYGLIERSWKAIPADSEMRLKMTDLCKIVHLVEETERKIAESN